MYTVTRTHQWTGPPPDRMYSLYMYCTLYAHIGSLFLLRQTINHAYKLHALQRTGYGIVDSYEIVVRYCTRSDVAKHVRQYLPLPPVFYNVACIAYCNAIVVHAGRSAEARYCRAVGRGCRVVLYPWIRPLWLCLSQA